MAPNPPAVIETDPIHIIAQHENALDNDVNPKTPVVQEKVGISGKGGQNADLIPKLRASSRLLAREFGFMSSTFAGTHLSSSAVHALIEISLRNTQKLPSNDDQSEIPEPGLSASDLCRDLVLEKSTVSRLLKKLVEDGEVVEVESGKDGRQKRLSLTAKGIETVNLINKVGNTQVEMALERLSGGATPQIVLQGIDGYANALRNARLGVQRADTSVKIAEGYRPGLVGRVIEMHMTFYSREFDFGPVFETMLAKGLGDLIPRVDGIKAQVWTAMINDKILGSVFIDTESKDLGSHAEGGTAHFRFFLMDDSLRGMGVGSKLVEQAMKWVDDRGLECQLWTFRDLIHARKMYDRAGFLLVEEGNSEKLGKVHWAQRFVRARKVVKSGARNNFVF